MTVGSLTTKGEIWDSDFYSKSVFERLSKSGKVKWAIDKEEYADITIFDNPKGQSYYQKIVFESMYQPLVAVDETGKDVWQLDSAITDPAFGKDGTIYVGVYEDEGSLRAYDMDGNMKWSIPVNIPRTPNVGKDGTVYTASYFHDMEGVGSMNYGSVFAINPDGTVKWTYESDGAFTQPILGKDGIVYTIKSVYGSSFPENDIIALSKDGKEILKYRAGTDFNHNLSVFGDQLLFSEDTTLISLKANGEKNWSTDMGDSYIKVSGVNQGNIYVETGSYSTPPRLFSLSMKDGSLNWEFSLAGQAAQDAYGNYQYPSVTHFEIGKQGVHVLTEIHETSTYRMIGHDGKLTWLENFAPGKLADLRVEMDWVYMATGSTVQKRNEGFMKNNNRFETKNPFSNVIEVKITDRSIKDSKSDYNIEIHYPELSYALNQRGMDKWNAEFKLAADEFKNYADEMIEDSREYGVEFMDFERTYEVTYNKDNLLSILTTISEYTGGVHPQSFRESHVINTETGESVTLKDLLGDNYWDIVNQKVMSEIYTKYNPYPGGFTGIQEDPEFYLTENGVVIYFQIYVYTPYSDGFPEFTIPLP